MLYSVFELGIGGFSVVVFFQGSVQVQRQLTVYQSWCRRLGFLFINESRDVHSLKCVFEESLRLGNGCCISGHLGAVGKGRTKPGGSLPYGRNE